jgi:hypothetical protein
VPAATPRHSTPGGGILPALGLGPPRWQEWAGIWDSEEEEERGAWGRAVEVAAGPGMDAGEGLGEGGAPREEQEREPFQLTGWTNIKMLM